MTFEEWYEKNFAGSVGDQVSGMKYAMSMAFDAGAEVGYKEGCEDVAFVADQREPGCY
jgi:hypothetical protein